MNKIYKCLFVFAILLVSVGFACASDDIAVNNETSVLSIDDNASVVSDDVLEVADNDIEEDLLGDINDEESVIGDSSDTKYYEIITSNITKYDFHDDYKVKVVDESGIAVYGGHIDFYVNHNLATTSNVSYFGYASFNLNSYIKSNGTYDIVSIYSNNEDYGSAVTRQSIVVDDVPMNQRDIQILFENIKLYELGEKYSVKVLDKNCNPVRKGSVTFIAYDKIIFSNIDETGIASFYLPRDLNITGNLLVWTMYSDGQLYDLAACEHITIGTRTMAALDKSSLGARMMHSWNNYNFTYHEDGMYIASIKDNVNLVLDVFGKCYLMYENTINNSAQLSNHFSTLSSSYDYDVVKLNLLEGTTYTLSDNVWEDQEWYYASRIANGQLIVNGNGATIKPGDDASDLLNFMYIGREANVNFVNVNLNKFNHVFINQGNLLCENCIFRENRAYKLDVKLSGSGTVVHNYNTVYFDHCGFYDNKAEYWGFITQEMDASILYAEPYSVNIFNGFYGRFKSNSLYCCNYTTTIFYDVDNNLVKDKLTDSVFAQNSYFATVDSMLINENRELTIDVHSKSELINAFYMLNTFITANKVTINLAHGTYEFNTDDYNKIRSYNYRHMEQDPPGPDYTPVQDQYLLDVGYCPVIINGNGATIKMTGNDDNDDYHLAYIGKYGSLKISGLVVERFNTAFFVTGSFEAYTSTFLDNVIDYSTVNGDYGGVFRSHGGKVTCHSCWFEGNRADNIGDYSTSDFYADMSSSVDLRICNGKPQGYMAGNSYLKSDAFSMQNVHGYTYYEKFEENYQTDDFKIFNVSDTNSYNNLRNYFSNHKVKSLYINFTGDYDFDLHPVFDRAMAIVFNSNGYKVKFNRMTLESPSTMTFIGFDFDNLMVNIKGSVTYINCKFHNNKQGEDYFFTNEGSCTLFNCDFYDNEGDDSIIYNKGSLTIYDSSFRNNEFDDDYGIIYNYGGSVSCINTTFSGNTEGKYIFNFASGNCAYSGSGITSSNVEFDEAWANWKAGLVQGAFLIATAALTYGAGTAIGAVMPGVAGLVVASVAGAGIGAASGLTYGLIEGNVYHDYSNVWKHTLTFAFIGLGLAQSGFAAQANFIRQVDQAFNNRANPAGQGGQPPQAPQNPQGGQGAGGLDALNENPAFQAEVKGSIEADIEALVNSIGNQYNQFVNYVQNTFRFLSVNPTVNMQELLALYSTMQTVLARQEVMQPQEVPVNIIDRVVNNQNVVAEDEQLPPAANLIPLDAGGLFNVVNQQIYLQSSIQNRPNINYISHMLDMNAYRYADANRTHAERVLNLLSNFNSLYNRARNVGSDQFSTGLNSALNLFYNNLGQHGHPRTINALFNFNNLNRISMWEHIYEGASNDLNKIINASNIREFDLDGQNNITTQIESRISNLIQQLDKRFENEPDYLDKYETLKDLYKNNNHNNLDLMMWIYRELSVMTKIPKINMNDYNDAISYDFIDLIKNNIYYSVFSMPNVFNNIGDYYDMLRDVEQNLNILREINVTVYNEVVSSVFSGQEYSVWYNNMKKLYDSNHETALRTVKGIYQQAYDYFNLFHRDGKLLNEAKINIYYVKNLFENYLDVYESLSDSNRILLNKYFHDQCSELIKSFNGLHMMQGILDETENFNKLSNISDTSREYFEKLTELYTILIASKGNNVLFNRNVTGLTSAQIGDMIIEDLLAYHKINYLRLELTTDFFKQHAQMFYLLSKVLNWANNNSIVNLQSFYNSMSAFREELQAVYTLEQQLFFEQPIDIDLYRDKVHSLITNRVWLSYEFGNTISKLFGYTNMVNHIDANKEYIVRWFIDQQNYPNMTRAQQEMEKLYRRTILYMSVFNNYHLKDSNIVKTKENLIELLLAEASSTYPFKKIFAEQYSALVDLDLDLDLDTIKQRQRDTDPNSEKFSEIDVADLTQKLELLKTASPIAYWVLMDQFREKYDEPLISETKWTFNKKESQFCTKDVNGQSITYYEFSISVIEAIEEIFREIGVIDGNQIILKSVNYDIARLVDNVNKYNNIFNKKAFYNQMALSPENIQMMIKDMEYDLNYLKNINEEAYDTLVNELFDGKDFADWVKQYEGDMDLLMIYNGIFDSLEPYRNNTKVMDNEVNVLINQMNNNIVNNLKINGLSSQIRTNLLYFIFFWEYLHKNTDSNSLIFGNGEPGCIMSYNLLNAPLKDIFNRYSEILNRIICSGVFIDDVDLNQLSLEEMKNLFNNNLYRAYHGSNRYAAVFEYLNTQSQEFIDAQGSNNFRAYENYINSIGDKNLLIEWYNAIRNIINPKGNADVKPNPNPNPVAQPVVTPEILNDIEKIILDDNIYDDDPNNIYKSKDEGYFMGSWKEFVKKYPELSDIVLKDLMKGDLGQFMGDNNYDFYVMREEIVKFLKNYKPSNKQPVEEKTSSITKSQFEDIKKIMEDCNIYPEKQYDVISEYMTRLYGSWEKIVDKYPDVSKKVSELLFNNVELSTYADKHGSSKNNYKNVRENIIEFIRLNLLKEDAPDVVNVDDPVKEDVISINGKSVSESTVDEIYKYTLNKIQTSHLENDVIRELSSKADSVFTGYLQYVDLMKSAQIPEIEYSKGLNQFKIRLLDILNKLNSNSNNYKNAFNEIKTLIYSNDYAAAVTGVSDVNYQVLLGSWMQVEKAYPDVAKHIMETYFLNNMNNFKMFFDGNGLSAARNQLMTWVSEYLYNNPDSSVPGANPNDHALFEKENIDGATLEKVIDYMDNAVKKADAFIEKIRNNDPVLADSLKNKVNSLYDEYLIHVKSYSHQYQYLKFIDALNKLFEDVTIPNPAVKENPQANKYHIQKEDLTALSPAKANEIINNTMATVKINVDTISKTNSQLGKWISNRASELLNKYGESIRAGDIKSYNAFINELNNLFKNSIGFASTSKIDAEVLKNMGEEDLKNLIKLKVHLNNHLRNALQSYMKLDQPNLNKKDLIDIYDNLNSYINKEAVLKDRNNVLTKGSIFFKLNSNHFLDINKVKDSLNRNLKAIKIFFPNLHESISRVFGSYLSRLSELSPDECVGLYVSLRIYTRNYFDFFKNSESFKEEMNLRNDLEEEFYDLHKDLLNTGTFSFFDSSNLYFVRNLDTADAETIKSVISSEMQYMDGHDQNAYRHYMNKYFKGYSSPAKYFESLKDTIPQDMQDKYFQDFYKNIQKEFDSIRNMLDVIGKLNTDTDKKNYYIESFEKAHNVDLSSDAAKFTRTLVIALMNLNIDKKDNLTNMLLQGLNKDGSLNKRVQNDILDNISHALYIATDGIFILNGADFEMFVDIMSLNYDHNFVVKIMSDYIHLFLDEGGETIYGTKDLPRYNLILSLILKNKLLFDSKNVVLYPEELDLLNNLSALRCYKIMNEILQLKLNPEFSNRNTVSERLIPGLQNNILNSMEYKLLNHKKVNTDDQHISRHYTIFNNVYKISDNLDDLVDLIDYELTQLQQFDPHLHMLIVTRYFMGRTLEDLIQSEYKFSYEKLKNTYIEIMKMFNFWRNKDIAYEVGQI